MSDIEKDHENNKKNQVDDLFLISNICHKLFVIIVCCLAFVSGMLWLAGKDSATAVPFILFMAGMLGGFIGLQRRLKDLTEKDLILLSDSIVYLSLSPLVGGILALVTYVIFLSGIIQSNLFPTFKVDSSCNGFGMIFCQSGVDYKDYAKLIVWCFISGFSEKFVTDILNRFEGDSVKSKIS